jgi:hypothetical protein
VPGYETHQQAAVRVGATTGVAAGGGAYWSTAEPVIAVLAAVCVFGAARIGGSAPDIDSHTSVPRRYFDRLVRLAVVAGGLALGYLFWTPIETATTDTLATVAPDAGLPPVIVAGVAVLVGAVVLATVAVWLVGTLMPPHRGLFHSPLLWLAVGVVAFVGLTVGLQALGAGSPAVPVVPLAVAGGFVLGAFTHLFQDGELL